MNVRLAPAAGAGHVTGHAAYFKCGYRCCNQPRDRIVVTLSFPVEYFVFKPFIVP